MTSHVEIFSTKSEIVEFEISGDSAMVAEACAMMHTNNDYFIGPLHFTKTLSTELGHPNSMAHYLRAPTR